MATMLTKPVTREISAEDWNKSGAGGKYRGRNMIVTLQPGGFVTFRFKATRMSYDLDVESAFSLAARKFAAKAAEDKKRERQSRKVGLS